MDNIMNSDSWNPRGHRRGRHFVLAQKNDVIELKSMPHTTTITQAREQDSPYAIEYQDILPKGEKTLAGTEEYLQNEADDLEDEDTLFESFGPPEWWPSPVTKHDDVLGYRESDNATAVQLTGLPPAGSATCLQQRSPVSIFDDNDFNQISPSHSLYSPQTGDDDPDRYAREVDDDCISYCTDPEEESLPCSQESVYPRRYAREVDDDSISYCTDPEEEGLPYFQKSICPEDDDRSRDCSSQIPLGPGWVSEYVNRPTNRGDRQAQDADWSSDFEHFDFEVADCHTFIVIELGVKQKIPILYCYSQGIQEVHRRLKIRYGDAHLKEAFAVFHDIMEFNDAALVHGDEAPEWNSWRGDYEYRVEELSNPGEPTGLIVRVKERIKRRDDLAKMLGPRKVKENVQPPGLDKNLIPRGLQSISNPSEGHRLASRDNPKVRRSQKADLKIVKDLHKTQYQKEVVIVGGRDVKEEMANAPFAKSLKTNPFKNIFHRCTRFISFGTSSSAAKTERARREHVTPWDKYESDAPWPIRQEATLPSRNLKHSESTTPLVLGSSTSGYAPTLRKSKSSVAIKPLKKTKNSSMVVQSGDVPALKKSKSFMAFKPLKKKVSFAAVQSDRDPRGPVARTLPTLEEVRTTVVTPPSALANSDLPLRVTQLGSSVHFLTPEEHMAAARHREGKAAARARQRPEVTKTPEIAEKVEAFRRLQRQPPVIDALPAPIDKQSAGAGDDPTDLYDHPLTPLLPEPLTANRRRVVRPVPDDDFDDTVVTAPRPRVTMAQRNEEFGWHVPTAGQVRLRPRRVADPMTPSPELMAPVRTRHIEDRFNPESFGLGRRDRPENVVITQHKVKQVYIQQPGLWTPKTSEINY
ncbi:hypothetical protein MMC18_005000 [Xylographa bjoerkii]|nr:hypothetical protein [Xylographa bjoerkii]